MRVLVTGGYGFIGFHVAERFAKEGYEVHIIDHISTADQLESKIHYKHRWHQLSVEDSKCEEIFRSYTFDAVVHLAAQVSVAVSIEEPRLDTESNVLGLVNMLSLAHKYKVKKFIFASSAAIYGMNEHIPLVENEPGNPISPYGISKWVGESYCAKWTELYELPTLCFRFSNVYGPRQGNGGEGGVVSIFMNRVLSNQKLTVYGDGEQTRDFIFVEDVADAIYRASYSSLIGVYNLSTNEASSVNDLVGVLKQFHMLEEVEYKAAKSGDIKHSRLDNTAIMTELDWAPKYDFSEGLARTYEWFQQHAARAQAAASIVPRSKLPWSELKRWLPYAENIIAFLVVLWLTIIDWNDSFEFVDINIFYIVIMGIVYGNRQAITAVALSIGLLVYEKLKVGSEFVSLLYDTEFFFKTAVYLSIGLVVGYAIERMKQMIASKDRQLQEVTDRNVFLQEVYAEVREVKEELQQRIMKSGDSFGKIYTITKELESLEPDQIFTATISVVESIMDTKAVSIYTMNNAQSYVRLIARSKHKDASVIKSFKVEDNLYMDQMLQDQKMFVNKALLPDVPSMAAPITNHGEVVAIIAIDHMKFENFSLYYQNLFKVVVDLISFALSRALSYVKVTEADRYVDDTLILKQEVFRQIIESKQEAKEKHNINYLLLTGNPVAMSLKQYAELIFSQLRETDYIGLGKNGQLYVLLSNTERTDAEFVRNRLMKHQIELLIADEGMSA